MESDANAHAITTNSKSIFVGVTNKEDYTPSLNLIFGETKLILEEAIILLDLNMFG
jgi:predicted Zn-dependent protease